MFLFSALTENYTFTGVDIYI